jgi:hypothetical protein
MVCLWSEGEAPPSLKAVLEQAEADAYATSMPEAVKLCIEFAKGERGKKEEEGAAPAPKSETVPVAAQEAAPKSGKKQPTTPRKPQTASA